MFDFTNFVHELNFLGAGVLATVNPLDGDGWCESIIFFGLIAITIFLLARGMAVPDWLKDLVIAITMLYVGFSAKKNGAKMQQ